MLVRNGIVTGRSADQITVQFTEAAACQTCHGCAGLREKSFTFATQNNILLNDAVIVSVEPRLLTLMTFVWFAVPVMLLVGVISLALQYGLTEILASLLASVFVFLFYCGLVKLQKLRPELFYPRPSVEQSLISWV